MLLKKINLLNINKIYKYKNNNKIIINYKI